MTFDQVIEAVKSVGFPSAVAVALVLHFVYMNRWFSRQLEKLHTDLDRLRVVMNTSERSAAQVESLQAKILELSHLLDQERRESKLLLQNLLQAGDSDSHRPIRIQSNNIERLAVVEMEGYALVQFKDSHLLDEANIQIIGEQLHRIIEQSKHKKIIVDFCNVHHLSSAALGTLFITHNKIVRASGSLVLARIDRQIYEVFVITKSNRLFRIFETLREATQYITSTSVTASMPAVPSTGEVAQPVPNSSNDGGPHELPPPSDS